jgi:membrane protein implicated in regulation of membrane protease activity
MRGFHWVVLVVGALGIGLLLLSHWVHALGVLPYAVLLACPLMHLFHRRHGGNRHRAPAPDREEGTP